MTGEGSAGGGSGGGGVWKVSWCVTEDVRTQLHRLGRMVSPNAGLESSLGSRVARMAAGVQQVSSQKEFD